MPTADILQVVNEGLYLVLLVAGPGLLAGLAAGGAAALLQGATQIQDPVLGFVPKLLAVFAALLLSGAWMGDQLLHFTRGLWERLPGLSL